MSSGREAFHVCGDRGDGRSERGDIHSVEEQLGVPCETSPTDDTLLVQHPLLLVCQDRLSGLDEPPGTVGQGYGEVVTAAERRGGIAEASKRVLVPAASGFSRQLFWVARTGQVAG